MNFLMYVIDPRGNFSIEHRIFPPCFSAICLQVTCLNSILQSQSGHLSLVRLLSPNKNQFLKMTAFVAEA